MSDEGIDRIDDAITRVYRGEEDERVSDQAAATARRAQINIRVSPALNDRLHAEAAARGLSINLLASALLAEGLDRLIPADEWRLTR